MELWVEQMGHSGVSLFESKKAVYPLKVFFNIFGRKLMFGGTGLCSSFSKEVS